MKNDVPVVNKNMSLLAKAIIWYFKFILFSFVFGLVMVVFTAVGIFPLKMFIACLPLWVPFFILVLVCVLLVIVACWQLLIKKIRKRI